MTEEYIDSDVTPESLMDSFKGPGLVKMVVITVVVHVVVIFGSSLSYLKQSVFGEDTSKMSKDERIASAVSDATEALRKIAKEHDLNPQDISDQFAMGSSRTAKQVAEMAKKESSEGAKEEPKGGAKEEPKEKSAIEKKIEEKADGPKMPTFDDKIF